MGHYIIVNDMVRECVGQAANETRKGEKKIIPHLSLPLSLSLSSSLPLFFSLFSFSFTNFFLKKP